VTTFLARTASLLLCSIAWFCRDQGAASETLLPTPADIQPSSECPGRCRRLVRYATLAIGSDPSFSQCAVQWRCERCDMITVSAPTPRVFTSVGCCE